MRRVMFLGFCGLLAASAQPRIVNGKVAPGQGTVASFAASQTEAAWIGYSVPAVAGTGRSCCWYNDFNGCLLEPRDDPPSGALKAAPIALESPKEVNVLVRVENKHVVRVRTFAPDCELDAGGLTLTWLTGIKPADSVRGMEALMRDTSMDTARDRERLRNGALDAISVTADPAAESLLEKMAADQNESYQRQALNGLSRRPEAFGFLTNMAKNDKSAKVRGDVLVILADRVGVKAIPVIQAALQNDSDKQVQQQAVRAFARLPKEEGVPLLIQTAKSETNPEARKEAIRQLGRVKDERALAFFESVLK